MTWLETTSVSMHKSKYSLPDRTLNMCEHAEQFDSWVIDHLKDIDETDLSEIELMINLLTKQYLNWYKRVSETHRNRVGKRGHQCIFHVFMEYLTRLDDMSIKLGPSVFIPAEPAPKFQDRGTLLGLTIEETD